MKRIWILGAPGAGMDVVEELLGAAGERVVYAAAPGRDGVIARVNPANARAVSAALGDAVCSRPSTEYGARPGDPWDHYRCRGCNGTKVVQGAIPLPTEGGVWIGCAPSQGLPPGAVVVEPRRDRPAAEFLPASLIGQVIDQIAAPLGRDLERHPPRRPPPPLRPGERPDPFGPRPSPEEAEAEASVDARNRARAEACRIPLDWGRHGPPGAQARPGPFHYGSSVTLTWVADARDRDPDAVNEMYASGGPPVWWVRLPDSGTRGQVWASVPEDAVFAAAEHCLAAALRGECPGVDPEALTRWRANRED